MMSFEEKKEFIEIIEEMHNKQNSKFIKQMWFKVGIPLLTVLIIGFFGFQVRTNNTLILQGSNIEHNTDDIIKNSQQHDDLVNLLIYGQLPNPSRRHTIKAKK